MKILIGQEYKTNNTILYNNISINKKIITPKSFEYFEYDGFKIKGRKDVYEGILFREQIEQETLNELKNVLNQLSHKHSLIEAINKIQKLLNKKLSKITFSDYIGAIGELFYFWSTSNQNFDKALKNIKFFNDKRYFDVINYKDEKIEIKTCSTNSYIFTFKYKQHQKKSPIDKYALINLEQSAKNNDALDIITKIYNYALTKPENSSYKILGRWYYKISQFHTQIFFSFSKSQILEIRHNEVGEIFNFKRNDIENAIARLNFSHQQKDFKLLKKIK